MRANNDAGDSLPGNPVRDPSCRVCGDPGQKRRQLCSLCRFRLGHPLLVRLFPLGHVLMLFLMGAISLVLNKLGLWLPAALGAGVALGIYATVGLSHAVDLFRIWSLAGHPAFLGPALLGTALLLGLGLAVICCFLSDLGLLLALAGGIIWGLLLLLLLTLALDRLLWAKEKRSSP